MIAMRVVLDSNNMPNSVNTYYLEHPETPNNPGGTCLAIYSGGKWDTTILFEDPDYPPTFHYMRMNFET